MANTISSQSMERILPPCLATYEWVSTTGCNAYAPEEAHEIATQIAEKKPHLLPTIIFWRWEMELNRKTINFDPRDPSSYKQVNIGPYIKRIIPDRIQPETEKFSGSNVPVFLPFKQKYPNNFDFTMVKNGQKLLSIQVQKNWFDIYASNSPLAQPPHTLLVPREPRSHFLLPIDLQTISILREQYPTVHFIYSSMGAGAGVNHQHWHMIAGQCEYPVLARPITFMYKGKNISIGHYPKWPTDCLVIERHNDYKMDVEIEFIRFLQQNNIPHNLFVQRNRTWINPRSHTETTLIPGKKYGAWETILGICNTCSQTQYDLVKASILEQALRKIQLEPGLKKKIIQKAESLV